MKKYEMLMTPDLAQKAHDGDKTVTRRLITSQPKERMEWFDGSSDMPAGWYEMVFDSASGCSPWKLKKPRYRPGMIVAVKETHWRWGRHERNDKGNWRFVPQYAKTHGDEVLFSKPPYLCPVDRLRTGYHRKPGIHMPFDDARTHVEILSVRPEQLQDIAEEDAVWEGIISDEDYHDNAGEENLFDCPVCQGFQVHEAFGESYGVIEVDCTDCDTAKKRFSILWDSINFKKAPWDSDPWVWRYSFRRVKKPA